MKYPEDFINKIICGDCIEVMKKMPDQEIDMIITSPPYNVGIEYDIYDDSLSEKDYLSFSKSYLMQCYRILKPDGRFAAVVPGGIGRSPYIPVAYKLLFLCEEFFSLRGTIIWYKGTMFGKTAWGSWQSPSNPGLRDFSELIIIAHKEIATKQDKRESDLTANEFLRFSKDLWFIPPENKRRDHPAPFPVEIPARLIKFYTYINDIILDPFVGIGTTARAAKNLKRKYIGIDISPNYCKIAEERLAQGVL